MSLQLSWSVYDALVKSVIVAYLLRLKNLS